HQGVSGRESLRYCELKTYWFHPVCCRGSFLPCRALVVEASSLSLLLCGLWVWARSSPPVSRPGTANLSASSGETRSVITGAVCASVEDLRSRVLPTAMTATFSRTVVV